MYSFQIYDNMLSKNMFYLTIKHSMPILFLSLNPILRSAINYTSIGHNKGLGTSGSRRLRVTPTKYNRIPLNLTYIIQS